jgi:translation initiation factor IF-3
MERIVKAVEEVGKAEHQPRFEGFTLSVRLVPK